MPSSGSVVSLRSSLAMLMMTAGAMFSLDCAARSERRS
jgi:hypothetical protein